MAWYDFTFTRRCIAVDLGESRIKAILAERKGNRIEILHAFNLNLQEEGLLTLEETNRHISRILLEMGEYPLALVIPQHIAISHLISLPSEEKGGSWERMIEQETQKLTGLSESAIVYDYFRLKPFPRNRNPVWVTVSRERDLVAQIDRLSNSGLMVSEVTSTGNALASAFIATQPPADRVALVDIGATATTVVLLEEMQPVYATAFPFGGELFTETLARGLAFEEAETVKRTESVFSERDQYPAFIEAVTRWHEELRNILSEGMQTPGKPDDEPLKVVLSGGTSLQPGFLEFLRERSRFDYQLWRDSAHGTDPQTYAVAYGAALSGLNLAPVKTSLLPRTLRQARFRMMQATALNALVAVLLVALLAVLILDSSAKREGLAAKRAVLEDLGNAFEQTAEVEELLILRDESYRSIVPIVQQQERTRDLLRTIELMQEVRAENEIWFTLLADGKSYEAESVANEQTEPRERKRRADREPLPSDVQAARWNRFVAGVAVPAEGRERLQVLRAVINGLRANGFYRNVDMVARADQQEIAEESVTLPGRTFSISLELEPDKLLLPLEEGEAQPPFQP